MNSTIPPRLVCRRWFVRIVLIFCSILCGPWTQASAQSYYRPEIYSNLGAQRPTGFRFGRFALHGAFGMIHTYDTNALYSELNPNADYVLQMITGADINYESPRLNLNSGYRFTFRNNWKSDEQDHFGHNANLNAKYLISRRLSVGAADKFENTSDPADVELPERLGRLTNEASGELAYKTPAEDLDLTLRYSHTYQRYDAALAALSFYNNKVSVTSRINVSSHFRFLPKSVASVSAEYGQTNFNDAVVGGLTNNDSRGINFSVGLTSQLSRKTSVNLGVGMSTLFFEAGPDATGITGTAGLGYAPSPRASLTVGYRRTVQVSSFTNYYTSHGFNLDAKWQFARRFEGYLKNNVDLLSFSGPNVTPLGPERDDFVVRSLVGVNYGIMSWAKVRVEYAMDYRDSNSTDPFFGTQSADFTKHGATLGLDLYY